MSMKRIAIAALVLAIGSTAGKFAFAEDPAGDLAKAPAAVQATVKKSLGDKKLEELDKSKLGDKLIYEAGYKVDGVDHSVLVNEAGEIVREEADIETSKVPDAVTKAVKVKEPTGKIDEAATATAGDKKFFAIDVKVGDQTHVVCVSEDGKVISDEVEKKAE